MDEMQQIAAQLRKPDGDMGKEVGLMMNRGNSQMNLCAIDALHIADNDKVLEIGMGNGAFAEDTLDAASDVSYTGCDYSALMVEEASLINSNFILEGKARFIHTDAINLPFEDQYFNKILTVNTIYFWEDPSKELSEIRRVLHNNGKLVIAIRPKDAMLTYPFTQYGFTLYSKEDLVSLLEQCGFKIDQVDELKEPTGQVQGQVLNLRTVLVTASKV